MADETIAPQKRCVKCGESKPATLEFFSPRRSRASGLASWCKACARLVMADKRRDPAYKAVERKRRIESYYEDAEKSRESSRRRTKAWREKNPETARRLADKWRSENPDRARASASARSKRWRENNPERRKAIVRASAAKRMADPATKLGRRMSTAVWKALKFYGISKSGRSWFDIVGYSPEALKRHLERQFAKGMSWDNYGQWHVDHILPLSSFKFASAEDSEFRAAWALTNLRPLWAPANSAKKDRRLFLL